MSSSPFALIKKKRFGPLFFVQFLGAFNDNLFKQALTILVVFSATELAQNEAQSGLYANLAAGLFILPYFLFSALAGQLTDKSEKTAMIKRIKLAEIILMAIAAVGFYFNSVTLLLFILFCMGAQSAFFGPAKYSILPELLKDDELMTGNGLIEMSTFLAILMGIMAGGYFITHAPMVVIIGICLVAAVGYFASTRIPKQMAINPNLDVKLNPIKETVNLIKLARENKTIFLSILGISWLWFFGATILAQLPNFTKYALMADADVATALIATFILGIGIGSYISIKFSQGEIEVGLVPFGAFGMSLFSADLYFINYPAHTDLVTLGAFLSHWDFTKVRIIFDLIALGAFSSFFVIPLYALIQFRSKPEKRARTIAANNVINAIFMVTASVMSIMLYQLGFNTTQIFLTVALMNIVVATYIFSLIPEFFMRFVLWLLAVFIYRLDYQGRANVPKTGPGVVICNHISFIDWFVITAACQRPVRFVMDHNIFKIPVLSWVFKLSNAIPIAPAKEDPNAKEAAFKEISNALKEGHLVCIFPEGMISHDGELNPFKPGVEQIVKNDPAPIIPMIISGLWGSFFSRKGGPAMSGLPKPQRRKIEVVIGEPLGPEATAKDLHAWTQKAKKNMPL